VSFSLNGDIVTIAGIDFTRGTWNAAVVEAAEKKAIAAIKQPAGAAPATDFSYDLTSDGKGILIKQYSGKGGKVIIPAKIEDLPVRELAQAAFLASDTLMKVYDGPGTNITSVVIPETVTHMGNYCFDGIENLTSVTIQGKNVRIGVWAFAHCTNLSELKFPDGENALIPYDPGGGITGVSFLGCKKLPLAVRAKLKAMGFAEP
jgi:hypothetical protein